MKEDGTAVELRRDLGLWTAIALVIGTVIGSGIFLVPRTMVLRVGSPFMVFIVWIFGGLLSLCGALSYAGGRWRVRLPARGLRTAVGIPLRLDANVGRQKRIDRHAGHGVLPLCDQ